MVILAKFAFQYTNKIKATASYGLVWRKGRFIQTHKEMTDYFNAADAEIED